MNNPELIIPEDDNEIPYVIMPSGVIIKVPYYLEADNRYEQFTEQWFDIAQNEFGNEAL